MTIKDHSDRRKEKNYFMFGTKTVQFGPNTTVLWSLKHLALSCLKRNGRYGTRTMTHIMLRLKNEHMSDVAFHMTHITICASHEPPGTCYESFFYLPEDAGGGRGGAPHTPSHYSSQVRQSRHRTAAYSFSFLEQNVEL